METQRQILILEKDQNLARTFGAMFSQTGQLVTIAANCEEALRSLHQASYQTIIVSQKTLGEKSFDFFTQLPDLLNEKVYLVILICDQQTVPRVELHEKIGIKYLLTPIEPDELLENILEYQQKN